MVAPFKGPLIPLHPERFCFLYLEFFFFAAVSAVHAAFRVPIEVDTANPTTKRKAITGKE